MIMSDRAHDPALYDDLSGLSSSARANSASRSNEAVNRNIRAGLGDMAVAARRGPAPMSSRRILSDFSRASMSTSLGQLADELEAFAD